MMGRGDADRVDGLVFEELADVGVGLRLGEPQLIHVRQPLAQHALVHVAKGHYLDIGNLGEQPDVVKAALADAAHRQADTLVGAQHLHLLRDCQAAGCPHKPQSRG